MLVVRSPKFLDDVAEAYAWIAPHSATAAERLLDRVDATVRRLALYPLVGAPRSDLVEGLRSVRVRPFRYLVFYHPQGGEVLLIRLLHGASALEQQRYEP